MSVRLPRCLFYLCVCDFSLNFVAYLNYSKVKKLLPILALMLSAGSCSHDAGVEIEVQNPTGYESVQTVELPATALLERLGTKWAVVLNADGDTVPSQHTHDGLLVFVAALGPGEAASYRIAGSDLQPAYGTVATGRVYPERADDLAWENEHVGFRAYGPATQRNGERAYGYDIFFKHRSEEPVLERMYAEQTSAANWALYDSIKAIDADAAREFEHSFTYHADHGQGMDCYAVGPTLGNGAAAFVHDGAIDYAWCYDSVKVLDRGPVRFAAHLIFAPRPIGADSYVAEHRIVTLDRGRWLNRQQTWFEGRSEAGEIGAGMPVRKGGSYKYGNGYVAVTDSTQGPDNGVALLGVVMPGSVPLDSLTDGHALVARAIAPSDTLVHYWGFAWDREDFGNIDAWADYLEAVAANIEKPFIIKGL